MAFKDSVKGVCRKAVYALPFALPAAAFAEGDQFTAFDTALTTMSGGLTTLVGKMAPAIVSIALIVLILPAVSWIVRRVRGALY